MTNNTSINNLEKTITKEFEDLTITLEFNKPYYVLIIKGFNSELEAKAYKENLRIGLNWTALNCNFGFEDELEFDKIHFPSDPYKTAQIWKNQLGLDKGERIDCIINGNSPSVYPTKSAIGIMTGGITSIVIGKNPDSILNNLIEGLAISNSINSIDIKLKTAIDIYNAHFFEQSSQAKFLTLIMALESISPHYHRHQIAQDIIDAIILNLEEKMLELEKDSEKYDALDSLKREITFKKEASLRSQIRLLVLETLKKNNNPLAKDYSKRAKDLYDTRSNLIHTGSIDPKILEKALIDAKEIVLLVLKSKLTTSKN